MAKRRTPPWKRANPKAKAGASRKLSAAKKRQAKASARAHGRRYPNLVDNMQAARSASGSQGKKREKPKSPGKSATARAKDPKGGLTAFGRAEFARSEGAHLRPGVTKRIADMSLEEMRRKGSWAVRFYGREGRLPPLVDARGEPTRFALSAAAWGEPVPKTAAAARRIAAKGRGLLARYKARRRAEASS